MPPTFEPYCDKLSSTGEYLLCGSMAGRTCKDRVLEAKPPATIPASSELGAPTPCRREVYLTLGNRLDLTERPKLSPNGRDLTIEHHLLPASGQVVIEDDAELNGGFPQTVLIFGAPGSGKSHMFKSVLAQLIELGSPAARSTLLPGGLVLDPKGNMGNSLQATCKQFGRTPTILRPGSKTVGANVLASGPFALKPEQRAQILTGAVMAALREDEEWLGQYNDVLLGAIVTAELLSRAVTLASLGRLLETRRRTTENGRDILEAAFVEEARQHHLSDRRLQRAELWFETADPQMVRHVLNFVGQCFGPLLEDDWQSFSAEAAERDAYSGILSDGQLILISADAGEAVTRNFVTTVAKAMFQTIVSQRLAAADGPLRDRPVFLACDEYAAVLVESQYLSDADFFSRSREFKCLNLLALQSVHSATGRIRSSNPDAQWGQILGNANLKVFFVLNDVETRRLAQDLGCERLTRVSTTNRSIGEEGTSFGSGENLMTLPQVPESVVGLVLKRGDGVAIGRLDGVTSTVDFFQTPRKTKWVERS
jgi:hypothetical protein